MKRYLVWLLMVLPLPALADEVRDRLNVDLETGGLYVKESRRVEGWDGLEIGPAASWLLHSRVSLYSSYMHGFPLDSKDDSKGILRTEARLQIHPGPSGHSISGSSLWFGVGWMWYERRDVKDWAGLQINALASWVVRPEALTFNVSYLHGFARTEAGALWPETAIDLFRVGIAANLYP